MSEKLSEQEAFEKWSQEWFGRYYSDVGYHQVDLFLSTLTGCDAPNPQHRIQEVLAVLQQQERQPQSENSFNFGQSSSEHGFFQSNKLTITSLPDVPKSFFNSIKGKNGN